jgi:hypothetical protein
MKVSVIGGNARNKGALLMLSATLEIIRKLPIKHLYIFTPFPDEDREFFQKMAKKNSFTQFSIIKWDQTRILYALFAGILRLNSNKINYALKNSDYVFDISGISFVSSRGIRYLIYNSLTIYLPWLNEAKIIKLPQSFGPIKGKFYSSVSRFFLNKCNHIFSRGSLSKSELDSIGVRSTLSTDLGFFYNIEQIKKPYTNIIGVNPSIVVEKYFTNSSINYYLFLEHLIKELSSKSHEVIVFPQSYQGDVSDNIFNDIKIIKDLKNKTNFPNVTFVLEDLDIDSLFEIYKKLIFV